jgi:hypothetical protein
MMTNPLISLWYRRLGIEPSTTSRSVDFESTASTNFTTPAWGCVYKKNASGCQSNYVIPSLERPRYPGGRPPPREVP